MVTESRPKVSLRQITHSFTELGGGASLILDRIELDLREGEFVSVVGPSGCGKSTLLNIISGLLVPDHGEILIEGRPVRGIQRDIGYMPSRDALLPWRTVLRNVEYGLEMQGVARRERSERAQRLIADVGLRGYEGHYPKQLSSGMRQRVATARIFCASPQILLMDEPFSALDAQTRVRVQNLFLRLWETERKTVLLITHDVAEAIALSDRVLVLSARPARIVDEVPIPIGRPRDARQLAATAAYQELQARIWDALEPAPADTPVLRAGRRASI